VVRGQWGYGERERQIRQTAEMDGTDTVIWIEVEGGSGGKESAQRTLKNLAGFRAYADRVIGDKATRAEPFAAQVEAGNIYLVKAPWNREYIAELEPFPVGQYTDQVDVSSGAFNKLEERKQARVL